ncbi:DUF4193 domain-containing protein [Pseudarthrobacter equi]|uniref:DUF4193 domain-containing protein n=1 Tax=Pseudarthrobacter TaxID=1742993 RepID=UPI00158470DC|nr:MULTISPECIES: DUF4193 domain-containing protein [Pseudarthrobacter]MCT9625977.1 DUF4193 domain-containing protein [Pseudarthrobacter equi]NUT72171.1 DUF4193 domain-containing protein [Pseudarthrobacter sp. C4D7]
MSVDYDAPRVAPEEETRDSLEEVKSNTTPAGAAIDVDEADLAEAFELPGADLSNEELLVQVIPVQSDEFTCSSCFLVHHRSQLAKEKDGSKYCTECEG